MAVELPAGLRVKRVQSFRDIVQEVSSPLLGTFKTYGHLAKVKIRAPLRNTPVQLYDADDEQEEEPKRPGSPTPSRPKKRTIAPKIMPPPKGWTVSEATEPGKPTDVNSWPPRMQAAYRQVAKDDEVLKEKLDDMLYAVGHRHTWEHAVWQIAASLSDQPHLTTSEVFVFIQRYEERVLEGVTRAFKRRAGINNNITFSKLEEICSDAGFTPLPHSVSQLIDEATQALNPGMNHTEEIFPELGCVLQSRRVSVVLKGVKHKDGVSMQVYLKFMELLVNREGFSKAEARSIERAFRRFDRDKSGFIEANEIKPIILWLGMYCDPNMSRNLLEEASVPTGGVTMSVFMRTMRAHRAIEYAHTRELFQRFDVDGRGLVAPRDLCLLFKKLGLCVLPDTLAELVEDCQLPREEFSFTGFWKVLQLLRQRDGFSSSDLKDITDTFRHFDRLHRGEITTRSVPNALRWLGYLMGSDVVEKVEWRREYCYKGNLSEPEFVKLVRNHAEANLRSVRMVFREYAEDYGASPMRFDRLKPALQILSFAYADHFDSWLQENMAGKWRDHDDATFNFEEFLRIAEGCRERIRDRVRTQCGFTERELIVLRTNFAAMSVKCGLTSLPPSKLIELFRCTVPAIQTSKNIRDLLRKALRVHRMEVSGLDWPCFLTIMRTFEDLLEDEIAAGSHLVIDELGLPARFVDDFLDIYARYLHEGPEGLSVSDLQFIVFPEALSKLAFGTCYKEMLAALNAWQIPDHKASAIREALVRMQEQKGAAGTVASFVYFTKELQANPSPQPRSGMSRLWSPNTRRSSVNSMIASGWGRKTAGNL